MFDFAPVGLAVATAGILFVSVVGWRLLPDRTRIDEREKEFLQGRYVAELRIGEETTSDGLVVEDLYPLADEHDLHILGLIRGGRRKRGLARREQLRPGDFLVVEGDPRALESFMGQADLSFAGAEKHESGVTAPGLTLSEVIVPEGARIAGRTEHSVGLLYRHSVTLLGVSREGGRFRDRVRQLAIQPGDVLLLLGTPERVATATEWLGCLPLEGRRTEVVQRTKAGWAIGIFGLAIGVAVLGAVSLAVALSAAVIAFVALGLVSGREVYESIEWKVIVLLACLIPLAEAFERLGGADLIAGGILGITGGFRPWAALLVLMVVTMTMSDFLNNVATALIAAPIALSIAGATDTNPDSYLMGVAVAASCAFLTPIGHKNNTIILGPGGYRFGDYWRMGLPLEVLVIAVALPVILVVWPL